MRMEYKKPMLYAESFTLVEHISQCAHLNSATQGDPDNCAFCLNGPGTTPAIFTENVAACTDKYLASDFPGTGDLNVQGYCYNQFLDEGTLLMQS